MHQCCQLSDYIAVWQTYIFVLQTKCLEQFAWWVVMQYTTDCVPTATIVSSLEADLKQGGIEQHQYDWAQVRLWRWLWENCNNSNS